MRRNEQVEQAIIAAAQRSFQRFGLEKTTMEDVAREAGKGKSSLYYYFPNKEAIFEAVVRTEMDSFFHDVKAAVEQESDVVAQMRTYLVVKVRTLRSKTNLYRVALEGGLANSIPELHTKLRKRYDKSEKAIIQAILERGTEAGTFTIPEHKNLVLIADLLVSCMRGIEMDMLTQNKFTGLDRSADFLAGILAKGLK